MEISCARHPAKRFHILACVTLQQCHEVGPITSSVIKARTVSKGKVSNSPKVTQQRKWDSNPGSLARYCCFLPESHRLSSSSLPTHLVLESVSQHPPKFIVWHVLTHLQGWGADHSLGICGQLYRFENSSLSLWTP